MAPLTTPGGLPGGGTFHTLVYPVGAGAPRQGMAFPSMVAGAIRTYTISVVAFCADAGTTIQTVTCEADPSLAGPADDLDWDAGTITLTVSGGNAAVPQPAIVFTVTLADGNLEIFSVYQPIEALAPALPAGAVPILPASNAAILATVL